MLKLYYVNILISGNLICLIVEDFKFEIYNNLIIILL